MWFLHRLISAAGCSYGRFGIGVQFFKHFYCKNLQQREAPISRIGIPAAMVYSSANAALLRAAVICSQLHCIVGSTKNDSQGSFVFFW